MPSCPVCDAPLDSMVCACGYDRSRDYTAYPTLAPLPPETPTFEMPCDNKSEPRSTILKCPVCGRKSVIGEEQDTPKCKCGTPLNPTDYFDSLCQTFHKDFDAENVVDRIKNVILNYENLLATAEKALSVIRYASPEAAENLENSLWELDLFASNEAFAPLLSSFPPLYAKIKKAIANQEIGQNIFDMWETSTAEIRQRQVQLAKGMGFIVRGDKIRFPAFRADYYLHHAQSPLFRDAAAAHAKENYETAAKLYQAAEAEGNPYAAVHLGMMYYYGRGCKQDYTAAAECFLRGSQRHCPLAAAWFCDCIRLGHGVEKEETTARRLYTSVLPALRQMSDAGDNDARYFLAFNLLKGICIKKDTAAGIRLLEQAHAQGHRGAAVQLASCYYYGEGVARSYDTAFQLLLENQTASNKKAQYLLGLCYYWGNGTSQNYDKAFPCFKRAAELGHGMAKDILGDCYRLGHGTEVNYAEAAKWYHDAADNHQQNYAAFSLGLLYYNGQGVEKNMETAVRYWMMAAEDGITQAQQLISWAYVDGNVLDQDYEAARTWMEKAAAQGDAEAMFSLGMYYISDFGFNDDKKCLEWIKKSAEQGYAPALFQLGRAYELGFEVDTNYKTALEWYQRAAAKDNPDALKAIGRLYLDGLGVGRDPDKGIEYLVKSADAGHKPAALELASRYHKGITDYQGQSSYTNPVLAHKYAMIAVEDEKDGEAQYLLGLIIHHSFGNPAGAKEWYRRAVANGCAEARLELSKVLIHIQENLNEAWELLQENTDAPIPKDQYAELQYWRSVCLENGWGTPKNKRLARECYDTAIRSGYVDTSKKKKRFGLF